ncbi:S-protein homolog 5-like isoform X1 [Benincasa hispida]|uniref:S-protein homolog 5-like isoform X1 n=2 Tax=Benincasa hispida TaxID=102211 RepID=UPI0019017219|nr:S-protein homolog 5-like isoform X1 [Benincasa hispida]
MSPLASKFFSPPQMKKKKILSTILVLFFFSSFSFFMFIIHPDRFYLHDVVFEVRVINGFRNNSSLPLVIWCSSKESDLGGRALQEHDDFSWKVTTKLWKSNQFSCTMKWDAKRRSFDAFKVPRDFYRCGNFKKCSWLVTEDGFYFSPDEVNWKKDFQW